MTLNQDQLGKVLRALGRRASLYVVDLERSEPWRVVLWSTCSMPMIGSSRAGPEIHWDERFFQLARHLFRAMSEPDRRIQLPTSGSIASLHLESVIWCALAERALNPGSLDTDFAMGIVLQSSMFLHNSMKVLGPFDEAFEEGEGFTQARMAMFEQFVSEHELAHYSIKTGERPSEDMLTNVGAAMRLIDQRLVELTARGDAPSKMLELFRFASEARHSQLIMEEIWADTLALEKMLDGLSTSDIGAQMPKSLLLWLVSQGALYGIAALRLLGLVKALTARSRDAFDQIWESQRRQFIARESYIRLILSAIIARGEDDPEISQDDQLKQLNELTYKLFIAVDQAESDWYDRWTSGLLQELREEGRESIERRGFDASLAINFCGERLGWFRGKRLSSPTTNVGETVTDEEAAEIAELGHQIHMMRGRTPEGRMAFFFILVPPAQEDAFRAALADDSEMDLTTFGRVIASSYGDRPSLEVLAYLKDRFGFDVPNHAMRGDDDEPQAAASADSNGAVGILRYFADRALRALAAFAVASAARHGEAPGEHRFLLTFDTRFNGVQLPDWLGQRFPETMTIVLQYQFQDLEFDDVAFDVTLRFEGEDARLRIPFLALTHFSDLPRSVDLEFPPIDPAALEGEQKFLQLAIAIVRLDLLAERIDWPTIEQRAHRAALVWVMSALARGLTVPEGGAFRLNLDPSVITTAPPGSWRTDDGGLAFTIEGDSPPIREVGEPMGWRVQPPGANEIFVPLRAVRRFTAVQGRADLEMRFDRPDIDWE